jgi:hypothetical protein
MRVSQFAKSVGVKSEEVVSLYNLTHPNEHLRAPSSAMPNMEPIEREAFIASLTAMPALSDCGWYSTPVLKRPKWAREDCGGRMMEHPSGLLCETHYNAFEEADRKSK